MAERVIDWWQKCQENGGTDVTKLIFKVNLNRGGTLAIAGGRIEEIGGGKIHLLGLTERGKRISLSGRTRLLSVKPAELETLF